MTLVQNTLEAGVANGTAVTTANSAFPDAFTTVTGTVTYSTAQAQAGTLSMTSAASSSYVEWTGVAGSALTGAAARVYFRFGSGSSMTGPVPFIYFRTGGSGTGLTTVALDNTLKLIVAGDTAGTLATTTGALTADTWYRVEFATTSPTTTTGTATLRVYLGDSTSAIANMSVDLTGVNTGASASGSCRIGRTTAATGTVTYFLDNVAFQTGSNALIGPAVVAPLVSAGDLTGSGTLSATSVVVRTGALTGSGTLSATSTVIRSVGLTGSGTLTATSVVVRAGALTGSGTLTATSSIAKAAALSGSGTLTATINAGVGANLTGSGTLSALVSAATHTVGLSGSGTLSATASGTLVAIPAVSADLTGDSLLAATSSYVRTRWGFRTPTRAVPFRLAGRGLTGTFDQGLTVWRDAAGVWRTQLSPTAATLAGATRVYAGGYDHQVDQAARDELAAAGFTIDS